MLFVSRAIIKAGCKIMLACNRSQKQRPEGRKASVLPWQSPRWAVLPYSMSCSYPPALWLWKAKKSSVNSLHRDTRDNQDRAENTDWLVTVSRENTLTIQQTWRRNYLLVYLGCLRQWKFFPRMHCPQGLLCLNPVSLAHFKFSLLKLCPYQKKK